MALVCCFSQFICVCVCVCDFGDVGGCDVINVGMRFFGESTAGQSTQANTGYRFRFFRNEHGWN